MSVPNTVHAFPLASFWLSLSSKFVTGSVLFNRVWTWISLCLVDDEKMKTTLCCVVLCAVFLFPLWFFCFPFISFHSILVLYSANHFLWVVREVFHAFFLFLRLLIEIDNHIHINMLSFRFCFAMDIHSHSHHVQNIELWKSRAKLLCSEQNVWHH